MMNNSSKILFFAVLLSSTMITVSANSWLGAWMGLEINLLSFIPLMSDNENSLTTEASLKYFLTQALASAVLLFSIIIFMFENNFMNSTNILLTKLMILSSLLMKSGSAPFHFWFPTVMSGLSWSNALILMTWQKMAPMMLVSYIIYSPMLMISAILSVTLGSLGGLNQTSLRKLMAYSSINHLGWMLASLTKSDSLWMNYFMFYSFLSITLILFFKIFNLSHINHLFSLFMHSKTMKFTMFMNLLSLGGLPPFLGFLPKWLVIQSLATNNQMILVMTLVVMTLITLFFYLRMGFAAFMLNYNESSWINKIETNKFMLYTYLIFSFISLSGLFMLPMIYFVL